MAPIFPSVLVTTQELNPVAIHQFLGLGLLIISSCPTHDQITTIDLPEEAAIQEKSSGKYSRTVVVDSTDSVSVHGYYGTPHSADGFFFMPTAVLDTHYVAKSYSYSYHSELAVSANQDETTVVIGEPVRIEIVLQQYETYQYFANGDDVTDVTGVKPVSVMSGHECVFVPFNVSNCDYLMEQIPPISALGSHYILVPFMGRE